MQSSRIYTYRDHLNFLIDNPQSDGWDYAHSLEEARRISPWNDLSSTAEYIVDYRTRQYPLVGRNCEQVMRHPRGAFLEGGLDFMLHHYHDFQVVNTMMFPDEVRFLAGHPEIAVENIRFTKSYRFRDRRGKLFTLLQQYTIIRAAGPPVVPVALFGFVWDITHFTEKGKIIHRIEQYDPVSAGWIPCLHKEYYPDIAPERLLGKREIEVLKWAVEGCSSKQIAEKLHMSVNTVNTHRRNMLRKTNSRNSLELLRYAIEHKLI